jgi:hypothetical protein
MNSVPYITHKGMKYYGFWKNEEAQTLPIPQDYVGTMVDRDKICRYLSSGIEAIGNRNP